MQFLDRKEAGYNLAEKLKNYAEQRNTIILALPRGGVSVAFEVAKKLKLPLEVFLVRKIGIPGHEETAMGAISADESIILNEALIKQLQIPALKVEQIIQKERQELRRRNSLYRQERPPLNLPGYTIILIDDGVATGFTIKAAALALRKQNPKEIIIATPVVAASTYRELPEIADQVIASLIPEDFRAVGEWYKNFPQVSDKEVLELLEHSPKLL